MPKLTIEFEADDFDEVDSRIKYGTLGHIGFSKLFDIDQKLRSIIKYDEMSYDDKKIEDAISLAEQIRSDIYMSGALEHYE
jgi:hypothetical protein